MGLSLMASAAACSARSFGSDHHHQREHFGVRFSRIPSRKEFTNMLPDHLRSDLLHLSQTQSIDIQKLKLYSELNQVVRQTSFTLLDVQDDPPDFLLMSFGIAKHCLNRENISHFLKSGSDLSNREKLDFPILSDLMVLHTLPIGISNLDLLNPIDDELCLYDDGDSTQYSLKIPPMSLVNFVGDVSCDAMITTTPNSPLLFIDNVAEMKVLSTMANLHMSKNADTCVKRRQMVVPFFRSHENTKVGGSNPKKKKKKSQKKKKTPAKVREIYSDSYSSVCESLLSVILIKNSKSMALCSLKRHGHKMPELLMKIAAGIAGIGLFAFISAAFKSTEGIAAITTDAAVGVPLFSTKLLNTGIGIGGDEMRASGRKMQKWYSVETSKKRGGKELEQVVSGTENGKMSSRMEEEKSAAARKRRRMIINAGSDSDSDSTAPVIGENMSTLDDNFETEKQKEREDERKRKEEEEVKKINDKSVVGGRRNLTDILVMEGAEGRDGQLETITEEEKKKINECVKKLGKEKKKMKKYVFKEASCTVEGLMDVVKNDMTSDDVMDIYAEILRSEMNGDERHTLKWVISLMSSMFKGSMEDGDYEELHRIYESLNQRSDDWEKIESVVMPLYEGKHWSLLLVDMKTKTLYHLNSLQRRRESRSEFERWTEWLLHFFSMTLRDFKYEEWNKEYVSSFPQQGGKTVDCGIFVMKAMECVANGKKMMWTENDVTTLRKRIFLQIMNVANPTTTKK